MDDINDNDPKFEHGDRIREFEKPENSRGETIVTLNATDLDEGRNGEITYRIKEPNLREYTFIVSFNSTMKSKPNSCPKISIRS